ncbi:hypothetical protein BDV26DRAFT_272596 [Aspergillus bertholletiae]|uniref:Homeobox domain-containing protein n=1 Tax=Aspergillus bertholletiae TaxID=1226010 RepID=A0A5N7AV68_9EURO|nr:hypothetical protein BDV26DRAFT_272596 [Aspergillus bertholletiae]
MSVSGPCIWMSSLPPPSSSHLTAITNSWSTSSWNVEQATSRTKAVAPGLPRSLEKETDLAKTPVDMQSAVVKAENAFPAGAPVGPSNSVRYSRVEMPSDISGNRSTQAEGDASLSRMKLERLNHSEPLLCLPRGGSSPQAPRELTPETRAGDQDEQHEHDKDNAEIGASSDEGAGSPRTALDPKTEKKKMKRFRLTHNQTRFLMSEFTRQAHPDAAHRERLSREIPGLTPRQVQVWFQNRRAKLKRLTSNDRERMLKSRALPEDFDTTQVLRTPFDSKTSSETPVPSPLNHMASISGANISKMLLTDGLQRLNDDDYVISPLSSASTTTGSGFPSATDRNLEGYIPNGTLANRAAPTPVSDLQRHNRSAFPFSRSSSFSEPSFNPSLHFPGRYSRPGETVSHPGMSYGRRPMDYGISRPGNSMVVGYDSHRQLDGSVSPTGQTDQSIAYGMDGHGQQLHSYQPSLTMPTSKGFGGVDLNSHMQPHGRHIPALQSLPVSDSPDYRHYSYSHHPYSMGTSMPYTQANASSMSLPASFPPDTGSASHGSVGGSSEDRINHPPQVLDPLRTKFSNQPFEYSNYL